MNAEAKVYSDLLAASADDIPFDTLVKTVVDYFGGGGGVVFESNRKTGEILDWATPSLIIGEDGYNDHLNAINPRMRYSLRHAPRHIAYERRFISERAMDRHEFYDWLGKFDGFRYMLGTRVYDDGDVSLFHSVEFSKKHGHPDTDKIEAFARLAPAIGNAWRLRSRVRASENRRESEIWLPDHVPWCIFALSKSGAVSGMNGAARAMAAKSDIVEIVDGALRAKHRASRATFQNALRSALSGTAAETLVATGSAGPPLIVQVLPVNASSVVPSTAPPALVYIQDPDAKSRNVGQSLGRLYGFTPAEQKLADLLASGLDLSTAAERLGLSRNTVRNRMQSMYAKSGTRRQGEFLVKVLGVLDT